jgi:hypothetical protein
MVDGVDSPVLDPTTVDKFKAAFAFDERETLLAGQYCCAGFDSCLMLAFQRFPDIYSAFYQWVEKSTFPRTIFASVPLSLFRRRE